MSSNSLRGFVGSLRNRSMNSDADRLSRIADSYSDIEADNAALKEENERLEREAINTLQMFTSSDARLAAQITENAALKARVAELEDERTDLFFPVVKEPANEGNFRINNED